MAVFGAVAGGAVEQGHERRYERVAGGQQGIVLLSGEGVDAGNLPGADAGQSFVVHHAQVGTRPEVLHVAGGAVANGGVKGGGLALQQALVAGVAADALRHVDALDRRVAGGAVGGQLRVRRRQLARRYLALPAHGLGHCHPEVGQGGRQHGPHPHQQPEQVGPVFEHQRNHRRPK